MKKALRFAFILFFGLGFHIAHSQVIFQDNFDSYVVDSIIDPQSTDWTGWDGIPTSAYITSDTSVSGTQSLKIWDALVPGSSVSLSDLTYSFGNKTTGRYLISFKVFNPSSANGKPAGGYWNMLHVYNGSAAGAEWAFQVYIRPPGSPSNIEVGGTVFPIVPKYNQWVNVAHIIDLDRDLHEFYYDAQLITSQPFSYQPFSTTGLKQLAAMDFFAECGGGNCEPLAYFDDFEFRNFPDPYNDAGLTALNVPDYCTGFPVTMDVTVKNFGFDTINSVTVDWEIDGVAQTPVLYNAAPLLPNATAVVNLGSNTFSGSNHTVKAWTSLPNSNLDSVNYNDTLVRHVTSPQVTGPDSICANTDFSLFTSGSGAGVSYDWQYYDSVSSAWIGTGAFTQELYVAGGVAQPTAYRVIRSCTGGGADTSAPFPVKLNSYLNCYCTPEYLSGCTWGEDLHSFVLTGVNSTSINDLNTMCASNGYYDDRTNLPAVDLVAGVTHHGTLNSSNYSGGSVRIWIDFNKDGQFQDSTELVGIVADYDFMMTPFQITIPSLADSGIHRMRVRSVYYAGGNPFDACAMEFNGEAHDYLVNIISPSCKVPYKQAANNITPYAADVSWTEAGLSTSWLIEYGPAGFAPGTGLDTILASTSTNLSGLLPNTGYEFYIRSICGRNDTSYAAGPFYFRTLCIPFTAPYYNGFENDAIEEVPSCWDAVETSIETTVQVYDYAFFNQPYKGMQALYLESGWLMTPGVDTLIAVSPAFSDLPLMDKQIRFFARINNVSDYMVIGTTPTPAANILNPIDTVWFAADDVFEEIILLFDSTSIYNGTDEYIYFEHGLLTSFNTITIDEFNYEQIPSCKKPRDLMVLNLTDTSADLSWTEKNLATEWYVEYGTAGFNQGSGTIDTVSINPFHIANLMANSEYEFYVRSICGRNDSSFWTGPFKFKTLCTPVSFYPYLQDFNPYLPSCWEVADNGTPLTGPVDKGFSSWWQQDFMNDANNGKGAAINLFYNWEKDWLISEPFDLSGAGVQPYELRMKVGITTYFGTQSSPMGSDDEVQVLISTDQGVTWTSLYTWNAGNAPGNTPTTMNFSLAGYHSPSAIFAIWATDGSVPDMVDYQFHVDKFEVRETPTCREPSNLAVSNVGSTSADLFWVENSAATEWQIEYGPAGFSLGTGRDSITASNPKTLNNLNAKNIYEYYVRSICTAGDTSFWAGPFRFETLLPPCTGQPNAVSIMAPSSVCAGVPFRLAAGNVTRANGITYDWQFFEPVSQTWISTGLTDFMDTVQGGILDSTSYRFITTCAFSGMADTSAAIMIRIKPTLQCYCVPEYTSGCASGDYIDSFTLTGAFGTSINDLATGCSPGAYDDRTALNPAVMEIGSSYSGTISSNFGSQYAQIWIDFDDDGNFAASENVAMVGPIGATPVTFTLNIPLGVDSGLHRMRVRDVWIGSSFTFDACSPESFGEAHDYMVYIGTLVNCAGAPDPVVIAAPAAVCTSLPFNVAASGVSFGSGISYKWEESPAGANTWTAVAGATGPSLSYQNGILAATDFRLITSCSNSSLADTSNVASVSIKGVLDCYCIPTYTTGCQYDDDINTFTLNGINSTFISDLNTGCSNGSYDDRTYLPAVDLVAGLTHSGTINSTSPWTDGYVKIWIDFNDDGTFSDSTELVGTISSFNTATKRFSITLPSSATPGKHRMRVRNVAYSSSLFFDACSQEGSGEVHDYFINTIMPTCPVPYKLVADSVTTNTASLSWIENGIATEWEVQHGVSGFMLGNGTSVTVTTKPLAISGLLPNTSYEFYVRSICGRGDTSYWAGPLYFSTPCTATSTFPYVENFDGSTTNDVWNCWSVINVDGGDTWRQQSMYVLPHSAPFVARGMGNQNDLLISPQFDLPATPMWVKLWDIVENANMNSIYSVLISTTGRNVADFTDTLATYDVQNTTWQERTIDLSAYANKKIYVALWQSYAASPYWDFGVDDFRIEQMPACVPPTNIKLHYVSADSVAIQWTENNNAPHWIIEYDTVGFLLGNGIKDTVTSNPASIIGLLPQGKYDFYVRSVCSATDKSTFAGPFTFTTSCASIATFPYQQTFTAFVPQCWEVAGTGDPISGPGGFGNGDWRQNPYLNAATNTQGASINLYADFHHDWLISEPFDLSGTTPYQLTMNVGVTDFLSSAADTMGVDDEVKLLVSTDGGLSWSTIHTWNAGNQPSHLGATVVFNLGAYASDNVSFALWATDGITYDPYDYQFHVDNFTIDVIQGIAEEPDLLHNISIQPNPSRGIFHIVGNNVKETVKFSIFNSTGKMVYRSDKAFINSFDERIDLKGLAKGMYFVKLQGRSSTEMKKIVLQ